MIANPTSVQALLAQAATRAREEARKKAAERENGIVNCHPCQTTQATAHPIVTNCYCPPDYTCQHPNCPQAWTGGAGLQRSARDHYGIPTFKETA